jgi:hypothetical protein
MLLFFYKKKFELTHQGKIKTEWKWNLVNYYKIKSRDEKFEEGRKTLFDV